jgi:hypothetical protein
MKTTKGASRRRGTIVICVLACLIVATALVASSTQAALRSRKSVRLQQQLRQTELLCQAGVLRAAQQLKKSDSYTGEQWRPRLGLEPPSHAVGSAPRGGEAVEAVVDIRVTAADDPQRRDVEVVATCDPHVMSAGPMQRSHHFTFQISATSASENP